MQMNPFLFFKKLIKLQLSLFMLTISLFSQIPSSESIISTLSSRKLIQSAISAPLNASSDSTSIVQLPLVLSTFHNLRIPARSSTALAWKTVILLKHPSPIQHSYTSEQTTKNPPIPNFIEKLLTQLVFFRCTHDPISHSQFPNYPNIFLIHPLFTCTLQSMYYATSKALSITVFAILHLRQNLHQMRIPSDSQILLMLQILMIANPTPATFISCLMAQLFGPPPSNLLLCFPQLKPNVSSSQMQLKKPSSSASSSPLSTWILTILR